jgi:hypothetical protein
MAVVWVPAADLARRLPDGNLMSRMNRVISMVLGVVTAAALSSCSVHGNVGRADLTAQPSTAGRFDHFRKPPGQLVMSYTTTDGSVHALEGRAWIEGDSLVLEPGGTAFVQPWRPADLRRVAIADLASVEAVDENGGATMVVVLGVIGALVGFAYLIIASYWGAMTF